MKKFKVKAQRSDGSTEILSISAESPRDAMDAVAIRGLNPINAELEVENTPISFGGGVKDDELYHFTRLFGTLTRAGIPIIETLEMLVNRADSQTMQDALKNIVASISDGNSLKSSFEKYPKIFDRTYLQLLEVGEESGKMPQVLERLTGLLKKRIQLRGMIIKALTYPMLVMVLSFIVVGAILIKIVPRFKEIYAKFGGDLPAITKFTLACSDALINYFPAFAGGTVLFVIILVLLKRTATGKRLYDRTVLSLPLFGQMFHTYEIAGFAKSFSMLIHSGITVTSAMELIRQSVDREPIRESITTAAEMIRQGKDIAQSFDSQLPWLPELLNRMVAVGERSGNLPEMLDHVSDFYEEEFNNKVETLASLIEPMLIVFLGVIIGGIVVSLYLPIFGMAKLISRR
ncbi:MAG TPA: type II secretion system F family protein [Candidatus Rifleibacterium sp.]|nr:type II secretion system F family protein [Candidatus Rifleibacterium sp.]